VDITLEYIFHHRWNSTVYSSTPKCQMCSGSETKRKMSGVFYFVTTLTWSCAPDHVVHQITTSTPAVPFTDMTSLLPYNVQNIKIFRPFKNTFHHNILIRTVPKFRDIIRHRCAVFFFCELAAIHEQKTKLWYMAVTTIAASLVVNDVNYRYQQTPCDCKMNI
jgi:hypothetical protein